MIYQHTFKRIIYHYTNLFFQIYIGTLEQYVIMFQYSGKLEINIAKNISIVYNYSKLYKEGNYGK